MEICNKRKLADENRVFNEAFEKYFLQAIISIVCKQAAAVIKEVNVMQHYDILDKIQYKEHSGKSQFDVAIYLSQGKDVKTRVDVTR